MLSDLAIRVRALLRRTTVERELEHELRFHSERQIEKYVQSGLSREEAMRRARLEFGGMDGVKEDCREARGVHFIETLSQDARYGARGLAKNPGFTIVAILTLALAIGATTAISSVLYAVLLRPLPYQDASRLVVLNETTPKVGTVSVSYPNFLDWRTAVRQVGFNLAGISQPENISGDAVSPAFLSTIGVRPFLGRDFDASEERAGTAPVLLLSYQLWQSHLGADPNAVGKAITLDGRSFTIVGVLPANFRGLDKTDVIVPIGVWATAVPDEAAGRGNRGDMVVVGRLAPGVTFPQARAEMEGVAARLEREYPATNDQFGVSLTPIRDEFVGDTRPAILVLFGAVMFVLLIACANVANLFLVRGEARTKEIALRIAFGASRSRIIRQMLTESFVLAFLGGALGVALAIAGIHGIAQLIPEDMLSGATVNVNAPVLLFAAGVVVLAAFIFGLAPALHSTNPDVQSELKEAGRSATPGAAQNSLRRALAITEISLALILLVGAGLMTKSLYRLMEVNPGFRPSSVLTMEMDLRTQQYAKDPAIINFWQQVLDGVGALPGVESAAVGTVAPLTGSHSRADITVEGMTQLKSGSYPHPDVHIVSAGYATALGIPLLRGRTFTDADNENAPHVGMINALMAKRYFPDGDPLGKRFGFGHSINDWITIVGVVGDTKLYGLANPARLEVYVPFRQSATTDMDLIVKSGTDPAALTSAIRGVVASIDHDQPIFAISTMDALVRDSVSTQRITLILLGLFSALALTLAAIGIYGVISYSVAQRTHEIGIRMALGAQRKEVLTMVLTQGAKIALVGVAIGLVASTGLARLMSSLLFSVGANDPLTFSAVAFLLIVVAMLACYIPARRATRVDPMVALRYE
jgi:putative ABC transport system permease protein